MNDFVIGPSAWPRRLRLWGLSLLLLLLAGCASILPPAATPTPAPTPTPTPTPPAEILRVPLARYDAIDGGFSLQRPEGWAPTPTAGGIRFLNPAGGASIEVYHQLLPPPVDPNAYLTGVISVTLLAAETYSAETFKVITDGTAAPDSVRRLEWVGRVQPDDPVQHIRGEWWIENNTLTGLTLTAPPAEWPQLATLWPLLRQSFAPRALTAPAPPDANAYYVHPSGLFTTPLPIGWTMVAEEEGGVLFSDWSGLAQFSINVVELEKRPAPSELAEALLIPLGDLSDQEGYTELARKEDSPQERMIRFDAPTTEEGFYRSELRSLASSNLLVVTSFSAPPHDWPLFAPAYDLMRASMTFRQPTLDEAAQDADPLAGLEVGSTMFYRSAGGALWTSAPIHNHRTRHVGDLTAAVQFYNAQNELLGAESWRLAQRVLPAGETTYLTLRMGADVLETAQVTFVAVNIIAAADTTEEPPQAWGYVGGNARINEDSDVILDVTLRNAGNEIRRYMYVVGLIYDNQGRLVFARGETQRLPYAVPPGAEVDVELVIWGPFTDLASFDILGEVPKLY